MVAARRITIDDKNILTDAWPHHLSHGFYNVLDCVV